MPTTARPGSGRMPLHSGRPQRWRSSTVPGAAKVACEQAVGENAFICRAGLIVGPEDPTGRFTYWPMRLDRGGEVLVPGTPDDAVQLIDVRDLAQWIVDAAQTRLTGYFDGNGPSYTRRRVLAGCADAL